MIFPNLKHENIVQLNDKTRFDANDSFVTIGETITNVEIEPDAGVGFISVYDGGDPDNIDENWFLDWAYETDGDKTISVKVTTDMGDKTSTYTINAITAENDKLFSVDADLYAYEPTLKRNLPQGKNSFLYAHRKSQEKIIAYLDEQRIWKQDKTKFTKDDLIDLDEFKQWSIFQTLLIIFESSQLVRDDIFQEKREGYEMDMKSARKRGGLRLDFNGDGTQATNETNNMVTTRLIRR